MVEKCIVMFMDLEESNKFSLVVYVALSFDFFSVDVLIFQILIYA